MNKQLTVALGLLTLSALFVGCNSNNASQESIVLEEISSEATIDSEENIDTLETTENLEESSENESTLEEETPDSTQDATSQEHIVDANVDTQKKEEVTTEKVPTKTEVTQSQTSSKPTTKPSTNTTTTSKPQSSTSTSEPQASTPPQTAPTPSPAPVQPEASPEDSSSNSTVTSLSCSSIFDQITIGMDDSTNMTVDATLLSDFYGIDASLLEDYCVKMPMLSYSITEVGVFKVKDVNNISSVVAGINKRANDVGIMLYPSLEETYERRQIVTKGQYILFVISDDVDSIVSNFNALV